MFCLSIFLRRSVAALALGAVLAGPAWAQIATLEQERLLPRTLSAPGDHEAAFEYVRASMAARDYEAAIAGLERILFFNPGLSRAKYELGVLYAYLNSHEMAVRHFEDALEDPDLDPEVRKRIAFALPDSRKELQQSRWYGVLQAGIRYNSNPSGVPGSGLIRSFGFDVPVFSTIGRGGDANVFALGQFRHIYDFQNQRGDLWETNILGYAARQFKFEQLSVGLLEVATGPRFAIAPGTLPGWTIRPYAVAGVSTLDKDFYSSSAGAGVTLRIPVFAFAHVEPGLEWRHVDVRNQALFGAAGQAVINTGSLFSASLAARVGLTDWAIFIGRVFWRRNEGDSAVFSSDHFGAEAAVRVDFDPLFKDIGARWSVTPFVRYTQVKFDAANPVIDPLVVRRDRQWRTGAQLDMPVTPTWGVNALVQYTRNDSNLSNYRASAWSVLAGPTMRF